MCYSVQQNVNTIFCIEKDNEISINTSTSKLVRKVHVALIETNGVCCYPVECIN